MTYIVGNDDNLITSTKSVLNSRFNIKDIELANILLEKKSKEHHRWIHSK